MVARFFAIPAKQECISAHKVRAQLGIEDDILRGLGMCLQQAKRAHVRTRALLASLLEKEITFLSDMKLYMDFNESMLVLVDTDNMFIDKERNCYVELEL